jgi:Flp pilus assembly protein TadD
MLGALSEHYLQTGHYRRALASLRRAAELKPEDASLRNKLATALLLDRDYDAAREFSSIQVMHPDDAGAQEGIAWSYFLEGRFERLTTPCGRSSILRSAIRSSQCCSTTSR